MLFTQYCSKFMAIVVLFAFFTYSLPAKAEIDLQAAQNALDTSKAAQAVLDGQTTSLNIQKKQNPELACATCGCSENCAVGGLIESTTSQTKDPSLLTDSLWGNLILEMAYQRDPQLQKLVKHMNGVNLLTMGAVVTVAGATIGQSASALYTINPPDGHLDSIAPGIVGMSASSIIFLSFAARMVLNHRYQKQLKAKQLALRQQVEGIVHHLEYSEAKCSEAQRELAKLIGDRASNEFLQLWQSSHQLASSGKSNITLLNTTRQVKQLEAMIP